MYAGRTKHIGKQHAVLGLRTPDVQQCAAEIHYKAANHRLRNTLTLEVAFMIRIPGITSDIHFPLTAVPPSPQFGKQKLSAKTLRHVSLLTSDSLQMTAPKLLGLLERNSVRWR
jgi:hypothetical protein